MPSGPSHDLALVIRLAKERNVVATQRVVSWLVNHDYDAGETLISILTSLRDCGRWTGSAELKNRAVADEYVVLYDEAEWYVKLYVDHEQVMVNVWSCCWDGTVH